MLPLACFSCERPDYEALFEGPHQVAGPSTLEYREPLEYDLQEYAEYDSMSFFSPPSPLAGLAPGSDEPEWVDPAAEGALAASIREQEAAGYDQLPTAALYLISPTVYREPRPATRLRVSYPPDGAVFPPRFCPIRIDWEDPFNDLWQVTVGAPGDTVLCTAITEEHSWWFPHDVWREVCSQALSKPAWIQVKGVKRTADGSRTGPIQASSRIHFSVSEWPADHFVVYRLVVPPFNTRKTPHTYCRDIRSFDEHPFLMSHDQYCFNCHSFSSKSGTDGRLSIQGRYMMPGGDLPVYFAVYDLDERRGWRVGVPFEVQMSTFMSWSPDARYLALSANQQVAALDPVTYETQWIGQPTSDLAIYDVDAGVTYLLPGGADPDRVELLPRWSLDGQRIVYCDGPPGLHAAQTQFDLREIGFNQGKGGLSRPVPGAHDNGRSNYYPRFSPDGHWLSFCQATGGSLIKASSDIYLLPADFSKAPHRLECNADFAADSWHSWSSGGHWLTFASKRDDGIYANLYFTLISDQGRASPAVRLPLREPPLASFNIPEFVAARPTVSESRLFEAVQVERPPQVVNQITQGGSWPH